jgi:hypothetical protein
MNPWKYNAAERKEIQGLCDSANSFNVKYSANEKEKSQVFQEGKYLKVQKVTVDKLPERTKDRIERNIGEPET